MTKTEFPWIADSIMAVSGAAVIVAAAIPALAQDLPNGNGKEAVQMICSGCHDLGPIINGVGFNREDWEIVVQNMIAMGATIKPEQVSAIADYLAQNFPPKPKK
jgi:virginiamycin B lyase